ncbi:MAG: hypothetical protein M1827_004093 [Pycnora praestabilis]|nr:MAG: hypothetical protein M1827_004093 [Pycnora praestabilis]
MIRVAIAGTGGLAQYIAHHIDAETSHQFVMLSRNPNPRLTLRGWQVIVVNYDDPPSLQYALAGVDTVISTVSGDPQLNLIDAAASVGVRRFAPAEYEGRPGLRPAGDVLDRGKTASLQRLRQYQDYIQEYTVFVCGVLYERFAPGGMATSAIGLQTGISGEGDFLMNIRQGQARIPRQPVAICMTSANDLGRFIVRALDLPQWPTEMTMCGERLSVADVVREAEYLRNQRFQTAQETPGSLQDALTYAQALQDVPEQWRILNFVATAEGRYDFVNPTLNAVVDFEPTGFRDWLRRAWASR